MRAGAPRASLLFLPPRELYNLGYVASPSKIHFTVHTNIYNRYINSMTDDRGRTAIGDPERPSVRHRASERASEFASRADCAKCVCVCVYKMTVRIERVSRVASVILRVVNFASTRRVIFHETSKRRKCVFSLEEGIT